MPTSSPAPTAPRSIHYRRRWYYALWVALLLASAGAWALWERPLSLASGSLAVRLVIQEAPAGTQVQVWAGPWARWTGPEWDGAGTIQVALHADGSASLPLFRIPIAQRRWFKGYIPRETWDLVMLKFTPPGGPPRFLAVPLSMDIRMGILRPRFRLTTTVTTKWAYLREEWQAPEPKP